MRREYSYSRRRSPRYRRSDNRKRYRLITTVFTLIILSILLGAGLWFYHKKITSQISQARMSLQKNERSLHALMRRHTVQERSKNSVQPGQNRWQRVQDHVGDAVVQVYSHVGQIDWLRPYAPPNEGIGSGSGFIINNQGHVVTNYHVVSQARLIQVRLAQLGQERFNMEIIGVCPDRDIALLRFTQEAKRDLLKKITTIPYVTLGNSDTVGRTQEVMALGYPLGGLSQKSTIGNISGWQRLGTQSFLQLTSPINPGNSGGPTVDLSGEVIGINSAGIPGAQNTGFFIPIAEVKNALKDLYKVKFLRKPVLGANFTIYPKTMREYLKNPPGGGWYITRVFPGTLLDRAKLRGGDVLYEIDGHQLDMYGDVEVSWAPDKKVSILDLLNRYTIGDKLDLVVYRRGKRIETSITLDSDFVLPIRKQYADFESIEYEMIGGMLVMQLNINILSLILNADGSKAPYLSKYALPEFQYDPQLIITHVVSDSPFDEAKVINAGSIIDTVNGEKVRTLEQLRKAVMLSKRMKFLTVTTQDEQRFAAVKLEDILKNEARLARIYRFDISPLIKKLS